MCEQDWKMYYYLGEKDSIIGKCTKTSIKMLGTNVMLYDTKSSRQQ